MPYVVTSNCILCSACVSGCEVEAITEGPEQCFIDSEVCIECGTCEMNCPSNAIIFMENEEFEKSTRRNK